MKMDMSELLSGSNDNRIYTKSLANVHEFYLGDIDSPEKYIQWYDTIRHAQENDLVKIYINSAGGDIATTIQLMRCMSETKATVIASVEGMCMSAATMIFLTADHQEITPHSMLMFHNYSGGTVGKGGEMIDELLHTTKWSTGLMTEIYEGFFTPEEIKQMLENRDFWMSPEEAVQRLDKREQLRANPIPVKKTPAKKTVAKKVTTKKQK